MNRNQTYGEFNIHDRRKGNNATHLREYNQMNNKDYNKNNQIYQRNNKLNPGNISHINYMNNDINNYNIGNNNQNVQDNATSFINNYNINPNDNYSNNSLNNVNNNMNSQVISSNYVNTHPILGKKQNYMFNNDTNSSGINILNNKDGNVINRPNNYSDKSFENKNNIMEIDNYPIYSHNKNVTMASHVNDVKTMHGFSNNRNVGYVQNFTNVPNVPNAMNMVNNKLVNPEMSVKENNDFVNDRLKFVNNNMHQFNDVINGNMLNNNTTNGFQTNNNIGNSFLKKANLFLSKGMEIMGQENNNTNNSGNDKGIVHNIFETLAKNTETNSELNNLVKRGVTNMVMNELEKKIEINNSSFIRNKLSILRDYFNVTHSYVLSKILFIIIPYIYIQKALFESRTYYVYTHLKKKMETNMQNKNYNSSFIFNGNYNTYNPNSDNINMNSNINNIQFENNKNNGNIFYNDKKENTEIDNKMNNNLNYINYNNNIGIFQADLYIPLMSIITYILLYTLTVTAQKNNFIFNPDNLFNASSYIFILLFFETTIVKFLFLLMCRDINLPFLHILSFISYKFVIMCALIITKIFYYFLYFMYTSAFGSIDDNLKNREFDKRHNSQVFKNLNNNSSFQFSPYSLILFLNSNAMYRLTQLYYYITVSIQMIQLFKSIHLYVHDNSNLSNKYNIKRINLMIFVFSLSQFFLCWLLTPYFN
ncbi:conserved Plasmodium protein, unknown function [Plasmodium berghei]|uniref:Protein transport protein YIF1, putative n=2 Tax=Plasmodium berghei TaxID=5821 RepID=A0A509AGH7_PLABA|nr:protein transport protein YIF1, putative [Plasmodium berghei ANKA]CXI24738.1 conserved Plasmodium protein, unknown function [Plasmodium berghei]SCM20320.1 conserved Plasmodium protein, unknown function [Plasmodium berghei]SCN23925.1 conserved Plasmodium protein, unknown function [Plasmodium berghei]SCO59309.1 conserved Plasmodium protein, unknown function [Plasmodium berghei]SCO60357.1 conserved Plasmodium protein, unknown function [Plasmodium berghei]|eukprot:XP_034420848.1 protein transport protein YIF1, putative [Plasmodium berghei ANKA]